MAPPRKPDIDRKTPYAVSLTIKQRDTLRAMGGSPWLQGVLDREAEFMEKGRKALPHLRVGSPERRWAQDDLNRARSRMLHVLATPAPGAGRGKKPAGKANRASCGTVAKPTPKQRVQAKYPQARCRFMDMLGAWIVTDMDGGRDLGASGSTTNFAWQHAAMRLSEG